MFRKLGDKFKLHKKDKECLQCVHYIRDQLLRELVQDSIQGFFLLKSMCDKDGKDFTEKAKKVLETLERSKDKNEPI